MSKQRAVHLQIRRAPVMAIEHIEELRPQAEGVVSLVRAKSEAFGDVQVFVRPGPVPQITHVGVLLRGERSRGWLRKQPRPPKILRSGWNCSKRLAAVITELRAKRPATQDVVVQPSFTRLPLPSRAEWQVIKHIALYFMRVVPRGQRVGELGDQIGILCEDGTRCLIRKGI